MDIKIHCSSGDVAFQKGLDSLVAQHLPQIDKTTKSFPVRSLLVAGESHKGKSIFDLKLSLILENQALTSSASSAHLDSAVSLAFRKLQRQVRVLKDGLRRTRTFEKVRAMKESEPRPEELRQLASELEAKVAAQDFLGFRQRLADLLGKLETFVRRELRFVEGGENLPNRAELAREIVEEALLHTFEKFRDKPQGLDPEKWIFRHALELIGEHVSSAREEMLENEWTRRHPSTALPGSAGSSEESASQEELLNDLENFPLEVVDFDTMSSGVAQNTAEEIRSTDSRREWLREAMESLPEEERKALFLCFLEGFRPVEAAVVLGTSEERLRAMLEEGAWRLRRQLHHIEGFQF